MRKLVAWRLAATLGMALAAAGVGAAADDSSDTAKPSSRAPTWQWTLFGGWPAANEHKDEKKPVEKKAAPKSEQTAAKKPTVPAKTRSLVDEAVAERRRQEVALLRRLEACDKLKEIAIRTNDNDLLRRAEKLEERAQTCYAQRTAHLRGVASNFESDEKTIDQYLGADRADSMDRSPYFVSGNDPGSRAAAKETKP